MSTETGEMVKDELDYAYRMGLDNALNGANQVNSHYSIFWHPEITKAWEAGHNAGKSEKERRVKP